VRAFIVLTAAAVVYKPGRKGSFRRVRRTMRLPFGGARHGPVRRLPPSAHVEAERESRSAIFDCTRR